MELSRRAGTRCFRNRDWHTELDEQTIDRWLARGTKLLKTLAHNPVVRGALLARGLTDEELNRKQSGMKLSSSDTVTPVPIVSRAQKQGRAQEDGGIR